MEAETAWTLLLQIQAVSLMCLLVQIHRSQLTTMYAAHVYVSTKIMKALRVSCKVIGTAAPYEDLVALHYDTVCFLKKVKECGIVH